MGVLARRKATKPFEHLRSSLCNQLKNESTYIGTVAGGDARPTYAVSAEGRNRTGTELRSGGF